MYDVDRRHFNAILAGVAGTTATAGAATLLAASPAVSAGLPTKHDVRLIPVFKADRVWNGVTTTRDGRVFVSYSSADRPGDRSRNCRPTVWDAPTQTRPGTRGSRAMIRRMPSSG